MMEQTTFGKYQLRERINVGGMAEVFLADVDSGAGFDGPVALKRVLPNVALNKEFISMFIDEARLSVQLNHGGIAQVLDLGQIDNSYFIALEHVDGKDLGAILKQARKSKQPMSLAVACYVATKICEALHYAHNKKDPAGKPLELVHRDVSPSNVLVSYKGDIKVTDFGLAKANGKATQTQAGVIKGKHGYMSPEQAQGHAIDRRSDLFSVGVCLYEMLTGQRLFKGENDFSTLQRVRAAEVPLLSAIDRRVPSELERIVNKLLARSTSDRYATADEVVRDLQGFTADSGNMSSPRDMAVYMQKLFSSEAEQAKNLAKKAPMGDGVTGLAAFADLEPVSTVSALIDLPHVSAPMLMTEQHLPVQPTYETPAAVAPQPARALSKRSATLVGMPLPAFAGDVMSQPSGGAVARASIPSRANTLPPPPRGSMAPRTSSAPPPPRASHSVAPPPPRASVAPRTSASLPPPPPRASIAPAALVAPVAPSVQLDWPEEDLATTRAHDFTDFQAADATEQIDLPPQHVFEDDAPKTSAYVPFELPKSGITDTHKMIAAAAVLLLVVGGAYAMFRGPDVATLKLDVSPADATVLLDGQQLATATPYLIEGLDPSKPHTLEVRKAGYSVWSSEVQLQPGETMALPAVALDPEKRETGFAIDSKPSGAKVLIDGQDTGLTTPVRMTELAPGTHRVELHGDGRAPWSTQVYVAHDQLVELAPAELVAGGEAVAAAGTDEVLLAQNDAVAEDEAASEAPTTRKLTKRQRRILAKRSRAARSASTTSKSSRTASRRSTASAASSTKAGHGTLRINSQPWSNVFVDGRLVGNTPQMAISLSAGNHRITLVNQPMGIRKLVEVKIVAGQVVTKIVKLSK